jgi:predicted ArsR family transcriptional regulator
MTYDLFIYPQRCGFKEPTTSRAAARSMDVTAGTIRAAVLAEINRKPQTADEVAAALGHTVLTARPRCAELRAKGTIVDSGERRTNASGKRAIVWRAV